MATVKRVWWKLLATAETGNKHSLQCKFILWQRLGGDKKKNFKNKNILHWKKYSGLRRTKNEHPKKLCYKISDSSKGVCSYAF